MANDLKNVVENINISYDANHAAAVYAIYTQRESGYDVCVDSLGAHLEILEENGARFDMYKAFQLCKKYLNTHTQIG